MTDSQVIDNIFGMLNRPLWIVTAAFDSEKLVDSKEPSVASSDRHGPVPPHGGLVATWISQASISPERPTVIAGIAPNHFTRELVDSSNAFALHLLRADQIDVALQFCVGSGRVRDKLAELDFVAGETEAPILTDCRAFMECRVFARMDCGDRIYYWADVLAGGHSSDGDLLTEHRFFSALDDAQKHALRSDREEDIRLQAPMNVAWRTSIPSELRPSILMPSLDR